MITWFVKNVLLGALLAPMLFLVLNADSATPSRLIFVFVQLDSLNLPALALVLALLDTLQILLPENVYLVKVGVKFVILLMFVPSAMIIITESLFREEPVDATLTKFFF